MRALAAIVWIVTAASSAGSPAASEGQTASPSNSVSAPSESRAPVTNLPALHGAPSPSAVSKAEKSATSVNGKAEATATIHGIVRYHADPARPWTLSRYYVKHPKDPRIAEAVVTIDPAPTFVASDTREPRTVEVDQIQFQFVPETAAIQTGDSVRFKNSDEALHNVFSGDSRAAFNVNMFKDGDYVHRFNEAGGVRRPIHLSCVYHGSMRGWIYVFDHPWFAVTDRDGAFTLENVPLGQHRLQVRHAAGNLVGSALITVAAGQTIDPASPLLIEIQKPASKSAE